ncbi:MAG TPA: hypothetical protein VMV35_04725 [Halothiobacillus sp.]|nr:hypothetical protein [Halothiobacillus sp.]
MVQANFHKKSMRNLIAKSLVVAAVASLAACNGGGVTPSSTSTTGGGGAGVSASPYSLFASTYVAYALQTNGAYLHSIQAGDIYTGFGGNYIYGSYSSSQADMNRTGLYTLQFQATATVPNTAADYTYMAFLAPADGTFDISAATNLVIQMGNTVTPDATHGNANVFTIDLNNTSGTTAATNDCAYDQTLSVVGNNVALTALGVRTYVIPLTSFTCSVGNLTNLQAGGITTVAVKVVGDKNTSVGASEYNTIAVGTIGFTGGVTAADQTALAQ